MFCKNCGKEIVENGKFCDKCGTNVNDIQSNGSFNNKERSQRTFQPNQNDFIMLGGSIFGIIFFFARINRAFFSYGVFCCGECFLLTGVILVSIIFGLKGLKSSFK